MVAAGVRGIRERWLWPLVLVPARDIIVLSGFTVAVVVRYSSSPYVVCSLSIVLDHHLATTNVNSDRSATLSPLCLPNATVKIWPLSMLILTVSPSPMSISTVLPPSLSLRCPNLVYRQHTNSTIVVISMPSALQ
ncbi:hypothetical protein Acr_00g0033150 [Actinidia rufa]|uniref:Uncharacterized protein n=1 Tax=Actinidia rufa TaxID=165716 RepID=A0A7J0DHI6_9ERIC|nr:hypothetical protein Acr_00g0033150 [Actinidia rufa]